MAAGSTITGNTITDNVEAASGIHVEAGVNAANVSVNFNNIEDNDDYGVYNGGTGTLDAENNWWGAASGPYHSTNLGGKGNAVSDYVDFEPWLLGVPTVTTQAATDVSVFYATVNMNYTVGGYSSVQVRFAYKKSTDSAWSYTDWVSKEADGTHAVKFSFMQLGLNTKYDFIAQLQYEDRHSD